MREWTVAGGLVNDDDRLLLVANRRRDGHVDWSPPGGVVDAGETVLEALTRETAEETGITVTAWTGPAWCVAVDFVDLGMHLEAEVHRALAWSGTLDVVDPDGIVTAADFCAPAACVERLAASPAWVAEPLLAWLEHPWDDTRRFVYVARGDHPRRLRTRRVEPPPLP